jgi:hypothetical protein
MSPSPVMKHHVSELSASLCYASQIKIVAPGQQNPALRAAGVTEIRLIEEKRPRHVSNERNLLPEAFWT